MKKLLQFLLLTSLITTNSCDDDDSDKLPPATQVGANTFGCLVNGEVWVPKGYNGTSNLDASYDLNFGGALNVNAYRITKSTDQFIAFGGINISTTGEYILNNTDDSPGALLSDKTTGCDYSDPDNIVDGKFIITKLDTSEGIVSGTFEFTFANDECDTLRVTDGRFDIKL